MYSLRRALAVRFSLTLFVALTVIAVWAMLGVRQTLRQHTDQGLSETLVAQQARLASGSRLAHLGPGIDFQSYFRTGNRLVVLRGGAGQIIDASVDTLTNFPLDTAAFLAALNGRSATATESWNGDQVRSVYARVPPGTPTQAPVIEVVASLRPLVEVNGRLLRVMGGTVLLGTLAVALGAFWLATAAVAPVSEVIAQAQSLDARSVVKRITAHSDVTEYQSLIEVLNGLLERCDRTLAGQRRLTADLGHELRTPLTALRGELEIALRTERVPAYYQKVLRSSLEEIDQLNSMCDSLLLINSIDSAAAPLRRLPADINEIALKSLHAEQEQIGERRLRIQTALNYAGHAVQLDPNLILKMMKELLENAVKFSPLAGSVALGTEEAGPGDLLFWVEDSGPGIAPDHLPHLFDPFFQADEARVREDGPGLGLTLAASIARAHGGSITASNRPDGGARFEVRIPSIPAGANDRGAEAA